MSRAVLKNVSRALLPCFIRYDRVRTNAEFLTLDPEELEVRDRARDAADPPLSLSGEGRPLSGPPCLDTIEDGPPRGVEFAVISCE